VLVKKNKKIYNNGYRGQESSLNTFRRSYIMALSNLFGWTKMAEGTPASACGTACGASDKPADTPAACGASDKPGDTPAACGASDKPSEAPAACGAGDK
jgi:ACGX-repeat protein